MVHTIPTFLLLTVVPLLALQRHRDAAEETRNVTRDSQTDVKAAWEKIARIEEQLEMYGERLNSYVSSKERKIRSPPENSEAAGVCDITLIRSDLSTLRSELQAKVPCVPGSGNVSTNLLHLETTIEEQASIIKSLQDEVLSLKTRLSYVESTLQKKESWCPPSWTLYGGSCYVWINMSLNWLDSQSLCRGFMGHLVEISSAKENAFVYNLISSKDVTEAWIGINDIVDDGNWVFTTSGRPLSYTQWKDGEPNNYQGIREDCGTFGKNGLWNDLHCTDYTQSSVCERSAFN